MVKMDDSESSFFGKKTLIFSFILILLIVAGAVYYYTRDSYSGAAAVVTLNGVSSNLIVTTVEVDKIIADAAKQNVTLNRSLVIDELVKQKLLEAQITKLGISVTDAQVDSLVNSQLANLEKQGLNEYLVAQNMSRDTVIIDMKKVGKQSLLRQVLFAKEIAPFVPVTVEQLQSLYTANSASFAVPESVNVKHILICYVGKSNCALNLTKEQADEAVKGLIDALQKNASFESLAAQYSTDSGSAKQGGDLGTIYAGQTVPEFEKVAFSTPVGSIAQPFESQFGHHIVMVYGKQAAKQQPFSEVALQLKNQLLMSQADALLSAYVSGLVGAAKIKIVG